MHLITQTTAAFFFGCRWNAQKNIRHDLIIKQMALEAHLFLFLSIIKQLSLNMLKLLPVRCLCTSVSAASFSRILFGGGFVKVVMRDFRLAWSSCQSQFLFFEVNRLMFDVQLGHCTKKLAASLEVVSGASGGGRSL